jgi:hypothetical protein
MWRTKSSNRSGPVRRQQKKHWDAIVKRGDELLERFEKANKK